MVGFWDKKWLVLGEGLVLGKVQKKTMRWGKENLKGLLVDDLKKLVVEASWRYNPLLMGCRPIDPSLLKGLLREDLVSMMNDYQVSEESVDQVISFRKEVKEKKRQRLMEERKVLAETFHERDRVIVSCEDDEDVAGIIVKKKRLHAIIEPVDDRDWETRTGRNFETMLSCLMKVTD